MRRHDFTLIELLTVIAIIVVLMGVLLGAVVKVKDKAKKVKAATMIRQLEMAISSYQSTYLNLLPFTAQSTAYDYQCIANNKNGQGGASGTNLTSGTYGTNGTSNGSNNTYNDLLACLAATNTTYNPRKQQFLQLEGNGTYKDPWGQDYNLVLDTTYNGTIPASSLIGSDTGVTNGIAIWSMGKDGLQGALGSGSNASANKDNVNNWSSTN